MSDKILCVDDEASVLSAYQRALRKSIDIDMAQGGEEGLRALMTGTKYAVIISDMNMPNMNGIQFLAKVKDLAPDSVRMMLTGANDLTTAMNAVNEGNIFRFLTKPCPPEVLLRSIEAGIKQHRLITAERELLEKTLAGCIGVLTEMLSLIDGEAFGRAEAMRGDIRVLAGQLGIADAWEVEVAAMLAQIGSVTVPPVVKIKAQAGLPLTAVEQDMLQRIPEVGGMLLANVPRLEGVGRTVLYINKHFDGGGFPCDSVKGDALPLGSRMLRLLSDLAALVDLRNREGRYDPAVVDAAMACLTKQVAKSTTPVIRDARIDQLRPGQILRSDIVTIDGQRLVSAGYTITAPMLERMTNFARITKLIEPVRVETDGT